MIKTKLALANKAQMLLTDNKFIGDWKQLAKGSPEFTRLQEYEFVSLWYKHYTSFDPVLSMARDADGKLVCLMCLAWHPKDRYITHAGSYGAEYHGWLATPEDSGIFLRETLQLIKDRFPIKVWKWRWTPPGISSRYFDGIENNGITVILEKRPALVWNLTHPEKLQNLKKRRSIRSKFNRYKRRGNYRYEIITDPKRTAEVLNIVSLQCDIRQYAVNNIMPFKSSPNKIPFCTAQQTYPDLAHVSAIWLDDQLLAFHFGTIDNKRVCLGMTSYDPSESKQSPGTLLLIELADILTIQGYEILDLTPGQDPYKERFANDSHELIRPTITFAKRTEYFEKALHLIRGGVMKILPILKIDLQTILDWKMNVIEYGRIYEAYGAKGLFQCFAKALFSKKIVYKYFIENIDTEARSSSDLLIQQQYYESLMRYENQIPLLTKRRFLQEALQKFGKGHQLLSSTTTEQLAWIAWLADTKKPMALRGVSEPVKIEGGSHILYDFYHANGQMPDIGFFEYLKNTILKIDSTGFSGLNICLESKQKLSKDQIASLGVSSVEKLVFTNLGGIRKKLRIKRVAVD